MACQEVSSTHRFSKEKTNKFSKFPSHPGLSRTQTFSTMHLIWQQKSSIYDIFVVVMTKKLQFESLACSFLLLLQPRKVITLIGAFSANYNARS